MNTQLIPDFILAALGIYALWQYRSSELLRMREEYGERGIDLRRTFWSYIKKQYSIFRESYEEKFQMKLPEKLNKLLDDAGPPPEIEKCDDISKYYDPKEIWNSKRTTENQKALREFALSVYRTPKPKAEIPEHASFNEARSRLGDFWERWTERFWFFTSYFTLSERYAKERHCLLLLSWLDPAHRKATDENHKGKRTMYRLARYLHKKKPMIGTDDHSEQRLEV